MAATAAVVPAATRAHLVTYFVPVVVLIGVMLYFVLTGALRR